MSTSLETLQRELAGHVVSPGDAVYDAARRIWNGMIDRRPATIVQAALVADIAPTIRFTQARGLPLAIRGGGHNVAGSGTVDDGIVLDLGALNTVSVDARTGEVHAGPGATLEDVDRATEPHHLAVPIGVVSGTGMAGLTLGGGVGWLTRAYGLTIDNMLGADVITADGRKARASATENPELFWGLRGGGGNFGVVSRFIFRAHQLGPELVTGNVIYGADQWTSALRAYAAWTADLPDAMTSIISFVVPPPDWDLGNELLMLVGFVWASQDRAEGTRWVEKLLAAAPPTAANLEPATWTGWQSAADGLFPKGARANGLTWQGIAFDIHHMGGAFGRVAEDATPFPSRDARYWLNIYGFWRDPADDAHHTEWVRSFAAEMDSHASGGVYLNFLGREPGAGEARGAALAVYGPRKLERLMALKRQYDPDNIFRLNHNIPPG